MIFTPVAQAILLFGALPNAPGLPPSRLFTVLALLVPLACYVWGLRDAPLLTKTRHTVLRYLVLGLTALALTVGGFIYGLEVITADMVAH